MYAIGSTCRVYCLDAATGKPVWEADFATGHQAATVYLGNGAGGFAAADGNLPAIGNIGRTGVSLGDVTGDGRDDLAFVNAARGLSVWTWVAPGVWRDLSGTLPATGTFDATQIADMNLDGHGDLVAHRPGVTTVYAGDSTGNWRIMATVTWPATANSISALRTGGDLDHNGYPDLGLVVSEQISTFTTRNKFRVFLERSTPNEPSIYAKFPRGGETFTAGSVRFLDWYAAIPPGVSSARMTIDLSVTGRDGPWTPVAQDQPNNGRFQWWVPPGMPATTNAYLRYTLTTNVGSTVAVTPRPFAIRV